MAKATIRCAAPPGFDGLFRAGRKWAASGVDVELLDGADDAPDVEGVPQIGTRSLAAIHADTRFSVNEVGSHQTVLELKARVAELEAENAKLKAELATKATADDADKASSKKGAAK